MKAGFSIVGLNLFSKCCFFATDLHSFTMLAAVRCLSFFVLLCYIFIQKFIVIFIAHFIHIGFVSCNKYESDPNESVTYGWLFTVATGTYT